MNFQSRFSAMMATAFIVTAASFTDAGAGEIQMIPPVTEGTTTACPSGSPRVLTWDGQTALACADGVTITGGKVGIGVTNPFTSLQVLGKAQFGTNRLDAFADPSEIVQIMSADNTSASLGFWQPGIAAGLLGTKANDPNFYITNDFSDVGLGAANYSITLTTNGYVGIKTTNPVMPLDVQFDIDNSINPNDWGAGQIIMTGATDTDKRLVLGFDTTENVGFIQPYISGTGYNNLLLNPSGGNVGIGNTNPSFVLDVTGQARFTGSYTTSDRRLKTNIADIGYGLDDVMKLHPVFFDWKKPVKGEEGRRVGFIAQEIKDVIPELVSIAPDEMKTEAVAYGNVTPVLVKAIQELKSDNDAETAEIKDEAAEIKDLTDRLAALEAARR